MNAESCYLAPSSVPIVLNKSGMSLDRNSRGYMKIDATSTLKSSNPWAESALDKSRTMQNGLTCSCRHRDCPNYGKKCIDDPDEPGVIRLPCSMEMPSIELCSTCCLFGYLEGICAFYRVDI